MSIIYYDKTSKTFTLNTEQTTYALCVKEDNSLLHLYYGQKIPETDFTYNHKNCAMAEYATHGTGDFGEPCLAVMDGFGMSAVEIRYKEHRIYKGKEKLCGLPALFENDGDEVWSLDIVCIDEHLNLEIILQYSVFPKKDIITRSVKAINKGDAIYLSRILSACLELDGREYDLITFNGSWGREMHRERLPLRLGKQGVDSSQGKTSHDHNNFIVVADKTATEDYGGVYGLMLVYSGSFLALCEVKQNEKTRIVMGINPFDFSFKLENGNEFQSPEVIMTFSGAGFTKMSHNFHDAIRENLVRGKWKNARRPILINNWEGTYFDFDAEKLIDIARESAKVGIEMLVMDDGWFGKRNDDTSSLGDWVVNTDKLKGGLEYLVSEVNKLGLKFGIWFEPEMVCPKSDLYKQHPDWCIHIDGRRRSTARSQLVLDFSREEVREHIYSMMVKILKSANIEYVKWDMNRLLTEVGNEILPADRQREIWHRYVLGVYELQERLITDFPDLLLENCSSGGARFDAGMLYYSPQIWTSDNTDAITRLRIQNGASFGYPCSCISAHVSASPNHCVGRVTPLKTRGHVALLGTFGYELDLTKLTDDEKGLVKEQIAEFDKYNPIIRNGDFYRIGDPFDSTRFDAWQFVSKDRNQTLFEFVSVLKEPARPSYKVKFKGLDPDKYYVHEESGDKFSGAFLMYSGFDIPGVWGDFQSYLAYFSIE